MRTRCFLLLFALGCSLRQPQEAALSDKDPLLALRGASPASSAASSQSGAVPASSPSASLPAGTTVVTRSLPASRLFTGGLSFDAKLRFSTPSEELVFGDIRPSVVESRPGVLIKSGGAWQALSLEGEAFQQSGWEHVSLSPDGALLVGAIDGQVESPGWKLEIVVSSDRGRSWRHTGALSKIYYFAHLQSFGLGADGTGFVSLILDDDYGAGNPAGVYRYEMKGWGASFGSPSYTPLPPGFTPGGSASYRVSDVTELEAILPRLP